MEDKKMELFGMPCSGKSTYLNATFAISEIAYADRLPLYYRLFGIIFEFFRSPGLIFLIIKTFKFIKLNNLFFHLIGIIRFYSRLNQLKGYLGNSRIQEEGLYQAMWGLFIGMKIEKKSLALAQQIFKKKLNDPRAVIYLSASKSTVYSREMAREKKTRLSVLLSRNPQKYSSCRSWMAYLLRLMRQQNRSIKIISSK